MRFLEGTGETRKGGLLKQLRAVWTHDLTAIEGNTLSLDLVEEARAAK